MKIIGIERVSYKNKIGNQIDGYRLYMGIPLEDPEKPFDNLGLKTMRWNKLTKRFEPIQYFIDKRIFDEVLKPFYNDPNLFTYEVELQFNESAQITNVKFK